MTECSVCGKPVSQDEDDTCEECNKTFCEEHNTIGSHSNNANIEELNHKCDECSIDWISGQADHIYETVKDRMEYP